jgi:hypothetical protein
MTSLYQQILPRLQQINAEGGNMSSHVIGETVLDALDASAEDNPNARALIRKIEETLRSYGGKRDHNGFNAIFEAYMEAVVFLAAADRGMALRAVPDGSTHGKTPDFETVAAPALGLEVKTLNAADPIRSVDAYMDRGFEAAWEAEQNSRQAAKTAPNGVGVGFGVTSFAPHGEGTEIKDAIVQTMAKIDSNVKHGQYEGRPTFLAVSIDRLGIHGGAGELRALLATDEGPRTGHLFAVAAQPAGAPFLGYKRDSYDGPENLGPLARVGVLRDHPYIAGVIFVNHVGSEAHSVDYLRFAVRLHGIWNSEWERNAPFSAADKAAAKAGFDRLCDAWNDLDDSQAATLVDDRPLHAAFYKHLEQLSTYTGQDPTAPGFADFMIEAERLHFAWRAVLRRVDVARHHELRTADDLVSGVLEDGRPVLSWAGQPAHKAVPVMSLVKIGRVWALDEAVGVFAAGPVTL